MPNKPPKRKFGGAQANAGRKAIAPEGKAIKSSIAMPEALWAIVDTHRGTLSRNQYIAQLVRSLPPAPAPPPKIAPPAVVKAHLKAQALKRSATAPRKSPPQSDARTKLPPTQ